MKQLKEKLDTRERENEREQFRVENLKRKELTNQTKPLRPQEYQDRYLRHQMYLTPTSSEDSLVSLRTEETFALRKGRQQVC